MLYRLDPLGELNPAGLSPNAVESGDGAPGTRCPWYVRSIAKLSDPLRFLAGGRAVSGAARPDG